MRTNLDVFPLNGEAKEAPRWRRRSIRFLVGYLFYVTMCFTVESYGRYKFDVQRDSAIAQIQSRRERLLALTKRATALSELQAWLPYQIYIVGSITAWLVIALAAGIVTVRFLSHSDGMRFSRIDHYVLAMMLSSGAVLMVGLTPPFLIQEMWEMYSWMSWKAAA